MITRQKGNLDYLTEPEPPRDDYSGFSLYHRSRRIRHLTQGELDIIANQLWDSGCKNWIFAPHTEPLEFEKYHIPVDPKEGGFWHRERRGYTPIITNWPAVREAAINFIQDIL